MKKKIAALALLSAVAAPLPAHATVNITLGAINEAVPAVNDFQALLAGLGLTGYTAGAGSNIVLNEDAWITFEVLGTESLFSDTFTAGSVSYTENVYYANHFAAPISIGSAFFTAGSLVNLLNFSTTNTGGDNATIGDDGFGIFYNLQGSRSQFVNQSVFYLGYDDFVAGADDNHDDLIIRATVNAVPEPATWAMMLLGFGALGMAMRSRRSSAPRIAIA